MQITDEDFSRAFTETMLHFKRTEKAKDDVLNKLLPEVLGYYEAALKDKREVEKLLKKIIN